MINALTNEAVQELREKKREWCLFSQQHSYTVAFSPWQLEDNDMILLFVHMIKKNENLLDINIFLKIQFRNLVKRV